MLPLDACETAVYLDKHFRADIAELDHEPGNFALTGTSNITQILRNLIIIRTCCATSLQLHFELDAEG